MGGGGGYLVHLSDEQFFCGRFVKPYQKGKVERSGKDRFVILSNFVVLGIFLTDFFYNRTSFERKNSGAGLKKLLPPTHPRTILGQVSPPPKFKYHMLGYFIKLHTEICRNFSEIYNKDSKVFV